MTEDAIVPSGLVDLRRDVMKTPDEVSAMQPLKGLGWGSKRIAAELGWFTWLPYSLRESSKAPKATRAG